MRMLPVLIIALCGCLPSPGPSATKESVTDTSGFVVTDFDKPKAQAKPSPIESPPAPVSETSLPPESEAGVSNHPVEKPIIICFTSQDGVYCPGCIAAKKWHDAADKGKLPFTLQFKTDYPEWIESVPTFYWKGKAEWKKIEGFYGGEHLVKAWEGTQ